MEKIETVIIPTKRVFFNEESGFSVYGVTVKPEDASKVKYNQYGNISISGNNIPELQNGVEYDVVIAEDKKSKYGNAYVVVRFGSFAPTNAEGQWKFLRALVTPNQYENIQSVFSSEDMIIDMIQSGEFMERKVYGFGETTFDTLKKKVSENIEISTAMAYFSEYNVTFNAIKSMVKQYGTSEKVIEVVKDNPYVLTNLDGFGFKRVDEIAMSMGVAKDSKNRIHECIRYVIGENLESGHSWIDQRDILNKTIDLLQISREKIENELFSKNIEGVSDITGKFSSTEVMECEYFIADEIIRRNLIERKSKDIDVDAIISKYETVNNISVSDEQKAFFEDFEDNNVSFLIGNAGTGKSMIQKILLEYSESLNMSVLLLSPTGKASKVLTQYTGKQAHTIHRRLVRPDSYIFDDVILVDEASMCDIFIIAKLLSRIQNDNAKIVFIGDDAQIPSVGTGNFLYDCIHSDVLKINKLTKVFRQKEGGILDIATKTREGERFIDSGYVGRRVFGKNCVLDSDFSDSIKNKVIERYTNVYKSGRWNIDDIVILTPTNVGDLGTIALNKEIQQIVNPKSDLKPEKTFGSQKNEVTFRVGDYVMNKKNKYDIEVMNGNTDETVNVFNGESGYIIDINLDEKFMIVDIDDSHVKYEFEDVLTTIMHSWVVTTYKAQGSEYKVVLAIVDKSATFQLNANLLYTAFSRAKEYMLILGQSRTLNIALGKFANLQRRCFLSDFLKIAYVVQKNPEKSLDSLLNG